MCAPMRIIACINDIWRLNIIDVQEIVYENVMIYLRDFDFLFWSPKRRHHIHKTMHTCQNKQE